MFRKKALQINELPGEKNSSLRTAWTYYIRNNYISTSCSVLTRRVDIRGGVGVKLFSNPSADQTIYYQIKWQNDRV